MDIYSYLKKDHRKVSKMMEELLATKSADERFDIFENIKFELLLHAKTEQDTFYKALAGRRGAEERIEEARDEHKEIEEYIKKLESMDMSSEEWIEQFGEFKHSVTHHVEEEENYIFVKAKKVLSDKRAMELAQEMDDLKNTRKYQNKAAA